MNAVKIFNDLNMLFNMPPHKSSGKWRMVGSSVMYYQDPKQLACSRLSDSGEYAKEKSTRKVGGTEKRKKGGRDPPLSPVSSRIRLSNQKLGKPKTWKYLREHQEIYQTAAVSRYKCQIFQ